MKYKRVHKFGCAHDGTCKNEGYDERARSNKYRNVLVRIE